MSIEQRKIRQFRCASCGGELELQNPRTRYVACPYCGSVADAKSDAFHVLTKHANPSDFPPRSFIKLGKEAKIEGKAYKVIGRTRWKSNYTEYWYEDGESGYEQGTWIYDEWLLISEDATYFYIIEDEEGFHFSRSIIPKYPSLPKDGKIEDFYTKKIRQASEFGTSEILYFEGESTYLVKPGRKVGFSQYSNNRIDNIAEWRYNDEGEIQEIEFFEEYGVNAKSLREAFMTDEERMQLEQEKRIKTLEKIKTRKLNKRIFQYGGLINFVVGLLLVVLYSGKEYSYQTIMEKTFKYPIQASESDFIIKDSAKIYVFEPEKELRIDKNYKSIEIVIKPEIPPETDVLFRLKILDENGKNVFERTTYAYDYKQYKGDRVAFAKGDFKETFAIDNLEGIYKIFFEMELPRYYVQKPNSGDKPKALVKISVLEKYPLDGGLMVFFGAMMLFISLMIRIPKI